MFYTVVVAVAFVLLALIICAKWKAKGKTEGGTAASQSDRTGQVVNQLCSKNNAVQGFQMEEKDSLDDHLDLLTKKLAEKEGRLLLSKYKIRETQHEIESLHAIDKDVRDRYREIMESLRTDLLNNERDCRKLQDQIEWVSRKRAELRDEVRRGQRLYGEAAAELASNLAELQRGRTGHVTDKPKPELSTSSLHHHYHPKEPHIPHASPAGSIVVKSPPREREENVPQRRHPTQFSS